MDPPRRAHLRRPRPQHRRRPPAGRPRGDLARLGSGLPPHRRAGLDRPRERVGRVSRGAGRQLARHVARGRTRIPARAPRRRAACLAAGRRRHGARSDDGLDRLRDDGERRVPPVPDDSLAHGEGGQVADPAGSGSRARCPRPSRADSRARGRPRAGIRRGGRHVRDPARRTIEADVPPAVRADRHGAGDRPPRSRADLGCRMGREGAGGALGGGRQRSCSPSSRVSSACTWVGCS